MKATNPDRNNHSPQNTHRPFYLTHPELIIYSVLVIIVFIAYLPALGFDFVWDDQIYITRNQHVLSGITVENIIWAFNFQNNVNYWHPLAYISHMLDIQLFGLNPAGHHLSSILIHAANSVLLFYVLEKMTGSMWRSAIVAALFALHPVNIESVAWIAERKNVLSTFFLLLTVLNYYRYTLHKSLWRYILTLLFFVLGLLTKPMLMTLPLLLLLLDFWPLDRYRTGFSPALFSKLVAEKIPLFVLSCLSYLITTLSFYSDSLNISRFVSTSFTPISTRVANVFVSYIKYIYKLVWPVNLACFYPFPEAIPLWQVTGSVIILIFITLLFAKFFKKRPYYLVGWLWFCVTLLPVSGLIQAGRWPEMADRFAYIPFIGLFIILVWGVFDRVRHENISRIIVLFTCIIALHMALTRYNLQFWKNDMSLFTRAEQVTENNWTMKDNLSRGYSNQGRQLQLAGELDDAEQKFMKAIQTYPGNKNSYNGLGINYMLKGDAQEALSQFKKALEIDPGFAIAHENTGIILLETDNIEASIFHLQEAVRLDPRSETAIEKLIEAVSRKNRDQPRE